MSVSKEYVVYCLKCIDGERTYIGCTNDLTRRLRQHNGEIVGGAKSTRGRRWKYLFIVRGFENRVEALQFEWRMHHPIPRGNYRGSSGRKRCLENTMRLERWTSKSPLASERKLIIEECVEE